MLQCCTSHTGAHLVTEIMLAISKLHAQHEERTGILVEPHQG